METIKSYTNLPQSRILSKILSRYSADLVYKFTGEGDPEDDRNFRHTPTVDPFAPGIPCWSLATLLEACEDKAFFVKARPSDCYNEKCWYAATTDPCNNGKIHKTDCYDNPIDALFAIIVYLHKQKRL